MTFKTLSLALNSCSKQILKIPSQGSVFEVSLSFSVGYLFKSLAENFSTDPSLSVKSLEKRKCSANMGGGKVEMKLIEDKASRQVTFSKRRAGLLKKAHEVSVLCDADIGLIIFSRTGELFDYCSQPQGMDQIIQRYQLAKGTQTPELRDSQSMSEKVRKENNRLELSLNHLNGSELNSIKYEDLEELEQQLQCSINKVRVRKEQLLKLEMDYLTRNVGKMEAENNQLCRWIEEQQASSSQQQVTIEANGLLEEKQWQVLNQFPFLGEEQPIGLLQLVSLPPHRPCLVQPMQSELGEANFHQQ